MQRSQRETITLDDILITEELQERSPRPPNWQAEAQAMQPLAQQMAGDSESLLQTLAEIALSLCQAGTAGVSLLETTPEGEEVFHWTVLAGKLAEYVGGSTPRHFSPCGVCLERGTPQLFSHPERYFTFFQQAKTPIIEGLVIPLIADNHALGTIWIISHDQGRHFDLEDVRVMTGLADFTATALLLNQRQTQELLAANARLEAEIAERKRTEETAREAEAYFRAIANLVPDMLWRNDTTGDTSWYNQRWLDYTGQTMEEAQGYGWLEVIHPDDRPQSLANFQNAIDQRRPLGQEHRIRSTKGEYRWFLVQTYPVLDTEGRITHWFGAATDIHDQRSALLALQDSEKRLQERTAMLERAERVGKMGHWTYNVGTQELFWSREARRIFVGEWEFELSYEAAANLVHPQDLPNLLAATDAALAQKHPLQVEYRIIRPDGVERTVYLEADLDFDATGQPVKMFGIVLDITERKQAEATLQESETKYRTLFENINDGFCIVEMLYDEDQTAYDYRFLEVSPSFEAQTGILQAKGRTAKEITPNPEARLIESYNRVVITGEPSRFEMWNEQLGKWYDIYAFLYGKPEDRQVAIVFTNINDRKQAQANQIQLIREQAAREEERQRAETLAQLDRAKTIFFSNVSHEFRTPLTLILAPLQDALTDCTHAIKCPQRERLELAHRNSLRLLKLVNSLLDFSRIEAGRQLAVYEPTDLAQFTTDLASVFRSTIERAGLRLIVDCPPMRSPVYVDRQMWEKIVLNLISNAFKFTCEGDIVVRLHPSDEDHVILQIKDTGIGIEPQELPHLFERFYQVRGAQARTHEGSGIGLALVQELIRLHGGTIEVSSIVGEGTCFRVTIPLGRNHLPNERIQAPSPLTSTAKSGVYVQEASWLLKPETKEEEKAITPSHSTRILIVDDNADMRDYLTRILSEHHQVIAVGDGATALATIKEQLPALVLSDVMMPQLDGVGLLKALRADPRTREIPLILLSSRAGVDSVVEGLQAGADDYLIKPFSAQELISRLNAHLQMTQLRSQALHQERLISRRKDELLSIISHELNTPLVAILGWTRLLQATPPSQLMLLKALETIERNATLQAKLIQDLLDISRITAGKLRLNQEPVDLKSVIEMAIATVSQTAQAKGIELVWSPTTDVIVMADSDRLVQVICNLLTNAVKFTLSGGRIRVELSVNKSENLNEPSYAEISVTDTGIGIAADFLPHVFEQFRQAEKIGSAKGLGLGLAIARHLVLLHNGTIKAISTGEGRGATFIVRLGLLENRQT